MKCNNCGYESGQDFTFCPACGTSQEQTNSAYPNLAYRRMVALFKDQLFFAICILITAVCVLSLLLKSIAVLAILAAVFLWLLYTGSTRNALEVKHMRNVSGVIYANYVINYIAAVAIAVCAALVGFVFNAIETYPELINAIEVELNGLPDIPVSKVIDIIIEYAWLFTLLFIVIAIGCLVFNILCFRKIHRLAKSAYESIESGDVYRIDVSCATSVKGWLWALGIISGISALSTLASGEMIAALSNGCYAAIYIIGAILIKKYILTETFDEYRF